MVKDYVAISEKTIDILGHKVKAVRERFSDEYLNSTRFESRCLRCCFNNSKICKFIRCNGYSIDDQTHFEKV